MDGVNSTKVRGLLTGYKLNGARASSVVERGYKAGYPQQSWFVTIDSTRQSIGGSEGGLCMSRN